MSLLKVWAPQFRSSVRVAGRAYQLQGKVRQQPPTPPIAAQAVVEGSRPYQVQIRRLDDPTTATCTCSLFVSGQLCKHIWATILDVQKRPPLSPLPPLPPLSPDSAASLSESAESVTEPTDATPWQTNGHACANDHRSPEPTDDEETNLASQNPTSTDAQQEPADHEQDDEDTQRTDSGGGIGMEGREGIGGGGARSFIADPYQKAKKRDPNQTPKKNVRAEPTWVGRLSLLKPSAMLPDPIELANEMAMENSGPLAHLRQVCYVVNAEMSQRSQSLVIEFQQRQPIRSGWSPLKPLRLSPASIAELTDPVDREIASMMIGCLGINFGQGERPAEKPYAAYRLPPDLWRSLLKRMVDTGRCFLDPPSSYGDGYASSADSDNASADSSAYPATLSGTSLVPLSWPLPHRVDPASADADDVLADFSGQTTYGQPWVLWAIGQNTGQELAVSVELRRGDQRMSIGRPQLILGGPQGILIHQGQVASFDDGDAHRWVTQFRDDLEEGGQAKSIMVPAEDVDRFLDRLYLLPKLPELDLPYGVGRVERHVPLVPHLDLLTPTASDAMIAGSPLKNMLIARVWFDYQGLSVVPGQPGRFLTPLPPPNPPLTPSSPLPSNSLNSPSPESTIDSHPDSSLIPSETSLLAPGNGSSISVEPEGESAGASVTTPLPPIENSSDAASASPPAATLEETDWENWRKENRQVELIRRDSDREKRELAALLALGYRADPTVGGLAASDQPALVGLLPIKQMAPTVTQLLMRGWTVRADRKPVRRAAAPSLSVVTGGSSGVDWFEIRGGINYQLALGQSQTVSLPQILQAVRQGQSMVTLGDGTQGLLPEEWLRAHGLLWNIAKIDGDVLKFKPSQAVLLDTLLAERDLAEVDQRFQETRHRLRHFQGIQPQNAADTFQGSLRPYQCQGLGWLAFWRWLGLGGILADDMGLGKTIQVLAMLDAEHQQARRENRTLPPTLVVVPRSVVFNWLDEAIRFTPQLRVLSYGGTQRQALRQQLSEYDLVVTSYGLMRRDITELANVNFHYVILDEAQSIKNPASQVAKSARLLQASHRLALTGTPVENHLGDLWSIFEFLNPGILGSSTAFNQLLRPPSPPSPASPASPASLPSSPSSFGAGSPASPIADSDESNTLGSRQLQNPDVAQQLGRTLRPFILRRTKKQVLSDLPEKTEQTIYCEMEPAQREVYVQLLKHYRGTLLSQVDRKGIAASALMVLEALLRLRQASCHPALIDPQRTELPSAKLEALMESLEDILAEGHKALIFSQFTSFLSLVRQRLDREKIAYEYLDGQTRHRKTRVQRFQTDPDCPLFLISLKAGGLGLNLTAAEYVFILDPWWNPAVENQAIDRAHRIGQMNHVFAYRLICRDSVEERIAELQSKKKQLADAIIDQQEGLIQSLTRQDLERLLS